MRKSLILLALITVAVMSVSMAADPWKIKVTDLDPNTPFVEQELCAAIIDDAVGSWGTNGGKFRAYFWNYELGGWNGTCEASFSVATGDLSFGTVTACSVAAGPWANLAKVSQYGVVKDGSTYKSWRRYGSWDGHEMQYLTSTDSINWSAAVYCTVYGATDTATGTYGFPGTVKTSSGVWFSMHCNSGAAYQNAGSFGSMTSGDGTTVWYDTDTGWPDSVLTPAYALTCGDPVSDPHTAGLSFEDRDNFGHSLVACDGNLMLFKGLFPMGYFAGDAGVYPWRGLGGFGGNGLGLVMGTAGQLCGGDQYVWLADPDGINTSGIGAPLIGAIGNVGLSGPSLRGRFWGAWAGYIGSALPLATDMGTPTTKAALFYEAMWDTDSTHGGDGYLTFGTGRAKFFMTKNKADLNYDGTVSAQDIAPFSAAYGSSVGQPAYNAECDFNGDGKVSAQDIAPFSARYGSGCVY